MDPQERDILAKAVADRVTENTKETLEAAAQWAIGVIDRTKSWLRFLEFAILAAVVAIYARLSVYWFIFGFVAAVAIFEWWIQRRARKQWQRYYFAGEHFRVLLECRKTLQSMTKEERGEVKPEVVKWFLSMCMPSGLAKLHRRPPDADGVFWDDVEEGVLFPATRRMKLERMGLSSRDDRDFPNPEMVEYAWDRYGEIDPGRELIAKLRVRGGYVESPGKFREALNRQKAAGAKDNA